MTAFNEMAKLCPKVNPDCNSSNQRIVLPTQWEPTFGYNTEHLLPYITNIHVDYERLFEFGRPKLIAPTYTMWKSSWFTLEWQIEFPFEFYGWKAASRHQINDDEETPIYETTPENMCVWMESTIILSSGSWPYKAWGLKDWKSKYTEILSFLDNSPKVVAKYRMEVEKANTEVLKWERELEKVATLTKIPTK